MRILIVEDDDKNRMPMRAVLAFKGYRRAEAEPGEDGARLARELHPDLILMGIQLPGINGITASRQIRDDPATAMIPAIAVTASAMTQDRKTIMAAGFPMISGAVRTALRCDVPQVPRCYADRAGPRPNSSYLDTKMK